MTTHLKKNWDSRHLFGTDAITVDEEVKNNWDRMSAYGHYRKLEDRVREGRRYYEFVLYFDPFSASDPRGELNQAVVVKKGRRVNNKPDIAYFYVRGEISAEWLTDTIVAVRGEFEPKRVWAPIVSNVPGEVILDVAEDLPWPPLTVLLRSAMRRLFRRRK